MKHQYRPNDQSDALIDAIDYLVHRGGLYKNQAIVDALEEVGFKTSRTQVRYAGATGGLDVNRWAINKRSRHPM